MSLLSCGAYKLLWWVAGGDHQKLDQHQDEEDEQHLEEDADRAGDLNWGQSVSFQLVSQS